MVRVNSSLCTGWQIADFLCTSLRFPGWHFAVVSKRGPRGGNRLFNRVRAGAVDDATRVQSYGLRQLRWLSLDL